MNFFQPIVENPNASAVVLTKKNLAWNSGLNYKGHFSERPRSLEFRAQMSKLHKGKKLSPEHRDAIIKANIGKKMSAEFCDNLSKAKAAYWAERVRPLMTPNGLFPSRVAVAKEAKVTPQTVDNWIKKWPQHYFYLEV
jgi:hypothetical protein